MVIKISNLYLSRLNFIYVASHSWFSLLSAAAPIPANCKDLWWMVLATWTCHLFSSTTIRVISLPHFCIVRLLCCFIFMKYMPPVICIYNCRKYSTHAEKKPKNIQIRLIRCSYTTPEERDLPCEVISIPSWSQSESTAFLGAFWRLRAQRMPRKGVNPGYNELKWFSNQVLFNIESIQRSRRHLHSGEKIRDQHGMS